ncbi:type IIL restriction-modification enzyme MmeI [Candidatus Skiveiella danica]|uniref:type IIL restriction-modification enzyme MmeI n=1 Tax=Candidatus Skiveiella danica TaxID=3386177 RepID=UPI0039B926D3
MNKIRHIPASLGHCQLSKSQHKACSMPAPNSRPASTPPRWPTCTTRSPCRPSLLKAHQKLDAAVDKAYEASGGKKSYKSDAERVAFLFELYQLQTSLLPADKPKVKRRAKADTPVGFVSGAPANA